MNLQTVITAKQAKQITGGRTPLLPGEYEQALACLENCVHLDEAKYWDNKSDVLAAWAKIYHSDDVMRKAKVLKLHAYRRMSQIAEEIRPFKGGSEGGGRAPGPQSFLRDSGFKKHVAEEIRAVGRVEKDAFDRYAASPRPPSPSFFKRLESNKESDKPVLMSVYSFRDFCLRTSADEVSGVAGNTRLLKEAARIIAEWADELDRRLAPRLTKER